MVKEDTPELIRELINAATERICRTCVHYKKDEDGTDIPHCDFCNRFDHWRARDNG